MTTTPEKIAELKRLLAEATPGPWEHIRTGNGQRDRSFLRRDWTGGEYVCEAGGDRNLNDLPLIAAAFNALPSMLTDIEMLRDALKAVSQKHPGYGGTGDIARKALAATEVQP